LGETRELEPNKIADKDPEPPREYKGRTGFKKREHAC